MPVRLGVPPKQVRVTFSPSKYSRKVSLKRGKSATSQRHAHVDDVLRCCARGCKYAHQIVERNARLHGDIAFNDVTGGGIDCTLAGQE